MDDNLEKKGKTNKIYRLISTLAQPWRKWIYFEEK